MRSRVSLAVLFAVLVLGPGISAAPDLDVEVPPGTPLDWDKELNQPTPVPVIGTGGPSRPQPKEEPKAEKGSGTRLAVHNPVKPAPTPAPTMGFSVPNLYNFFRVTTSDIMNHITPNFRTKEPRPWEPPPGETAPPPPPTIETGRATAENPKGRAEAVPAIPLRHGVQGGYPPRTPGELGWMSVLVGLRAQLHPETVNVAEAAAYVAEIGGNMDIPDAAPPFPSMKTPVDRMLSKLIVLEICSGWPYSMDPTFAKKTLMLGDLSFNTIVESAKSGHPFLRNNAVAILANFQGEKAGDELLKFYERAPDTTGKIRALAGLGRKRYLKAIPKLMNALGHSDDGVNAMAIYALSQIAAAAPEKDKVAAAKRLTGLFQSKPDIVWSALAAIARIGAKDKSVADACVGIKNAFKDKAAAVGPPVPQQGATGPVTPDPAGAKNKIIYHCAILAAGASGDAQSATQACSLGLSGMMQSVWILAAEVFPNLGPQGVSIAQGLVGHESTSVAVAAVRSLGRFKEHVGWLKGVASSARPIVRGAALCALIGLDDEALVEAAKPIVSGESVANAEDAFLVSLAIQMLDTLGKNDGAAVLGVVQRARAANAVARRTAVDEYNLLRAKIDIFPPLLEVATLALGKTQHEPALSELVSLLAPGSLVRGEAALALGSFSTSALIVPAAEALLQALVEPSDGFVRFCAYLSLKALSGQDHSADYIFGGIGDVWPAALKYRDWLVGLRKTLAAAEPAPAPAPAENR
jgi:HEAT repeat protein